MRKYILVLLSLLLVLTSCVTNSPSFYSTNEKTFETRTLKNGVTLIVKKNENNRVLNLKIVLNGGSAFATEQKAGLESVMMELLTRGSASFSYDEILQASYEKTAGISASSSADFASYELNCLDKYFDNLFAMYIDGFTNPLFDEEQFNNILTDYAQAYEEMLGNADKFGQEEARKILYKDHPYLPRPNGDMDSLSSITLDDVKKYYAEKVSAERLFVVAVGNYNTDDLEKKLNESIGAIPKKSLSLPSIPKVIVKSDAVKLENPTAKGSGYVQGYFAIPNRDSSDYVPLAIASDMLDDLFFAIVREKYGACYSVSTGFMGSKASYGMFWVFKTTKQAEIKSYIDEALSLFAKDKLITAKDPSDPSGEKYIYASIDEKLAAYKNKYINSFFSVQKTNADISGQIARSVILLGNPMDYMKVVDKINATTSADIKRVFANYVTNAPIMWTLVSDAEGLAKFKLDDYKKITIK